MAKTVTLRVASGTYETFVRAAAAEGRSLSNMIITAALQRIREGQLVSDSEMAEILRDRDLVRRLKRGHADAKKRKGRFVWPL